MPPPSLSSSTTVSFSPGLVAASSPPMSWASATSPISSTTGPRAAGEDGADGAGGVLPGALGVERHLQRVVEPVQPGAQRLGGGEVADPDHQLGPVLLGPAGVAEQRIVVRDRGGAAAGAGQRV